MAIEKKQPGLSRYIPKNEHGDFPASYVLPEGNPISKGLKKVISRGKTVDPTDEGANGHATGVRTAAGSAPMPPAEAVKLLKDAWLSYSVGIHRSESRGLATLKRWISKGP